MSYQQLCIANFKQFAEINEYTRDLDESLLFGDILFQLSNTTLIKDGKKEIARQRSQLAKRLDMSISTIQRKLKSLKEYSLISISLRKWFGKKRMFISSEKDIHFSINITKLHFLNEYTDDTKCSIALSYFAYQLMQSDCHTRYGKDWCYVPKADLAKLLVASEMTAHQTVKKLETTGLIDRKGQYGGEAAFLVRINPTKLAEISAEWEVREEKYAAEKKAKAEAKAAKNAVQNLEKSSNLELSINNRDIDTIYIKNNNIDITESSINFEQTGYELSSQQRKYLDVALERTVLNAKVPLIDFSLLKQEVNFAIESIGHRKGTLSFKHAVNRFMLLIRNGDWKTPFGYHKYSDECRETYQHIKVHEKAHYEQKSARALANLRNAGELPPELNIVVPDIAFSPPRIEVVAEDEERKKKLADLERRWQESKYGGA